VAAYREAHRPHRKPTAFEAVLRDVGAKTFAEGFDAAVKAMKG
jgi:hypothetical protein